MPEVTLPRASRNETEAAAMRAFGFDPEEELMPNLIADMVVNHAAAKVVGKVVEPLVNPGQAPSKAGVPARAARRVWNKIIDALTPSAPGEPPGKLSIFVTLAVLAGGILAVGFIVREVARTVRIAKAV